jgi:predicted nucleotide-binding protein
MPSILDRFSGKDGRRNLIEALRSQKIVAHSDEIAHKLADVASLEQQAINTALMTQGDATNDIFFILIGDVSVRINGREVNVRHAGEHIGEMAAIDVKALRSATAIVISEAVTAKVSEQDFAKIANEHPTIWRALASELAERLRQRGALVAARRTNPDLFIGSSVEGLPVARAIQTAFQYDPIVVRLWTDGVFRASKTAVENLENTIQTTDFGILVFSADDKIESRGDSSMGPRDNVIFEMGLLIGALGRQRAFVVHQRGIDLKIPTDLVGFSPVTYSLDPDLIRRDPKAAHDAAIGPVYSELRDIILKMGSK